MFHPKLQKLQKVCGQGGAAPTLRHLGAALVSSICDYQIQEVRLRVIGAQDPPLSAREEEAQRAIECVIVEPGESIEPYAAEFSASFRDTFASLQKRLDDGCILIFARTARPDGAGREVAGYGIMERGGFSSLGIKGKLPDHIMFMHYTEVAQRYRGQRIAQVMSRARNEYYRKHGITGGLSTHSPGNTASDRAFGKFGSGVVCQAVRVSIFRGLISWHTPWKNIERAITGPLPRSSSARTTAKLPQLN